ncbi:MAG TPA: PIN domain-containing protein [Thermoanaerobaculia bacterium]|nr:PIN domain-containing protein [Thermoanaerobaculia bacterium]
MILVDAGPLVAVIDAGDGQHERCTIALRSIEEPLLTVWPALTEAMYLLRFSLEAQEAIWGDVEKGTLRLADLDADDFPRMRHLMRKYRDLPMDLADAALVAVAERERISRIFTLDRRDFEVYRPAGIRRFEIIP